MHGLTFDIARDVEIAIDARIKVTRTPPPPSVPLVRLTMSYGGVKSTHTGATSMAYTLRNDQQVGLQIAYIDAGGNPAEVDGAVTWESSDDTIAAVEDPSSDGTNVMLVAQGNGNCQIKATADADLGSGVRELITLMDVTVVSGEAVAGTITPVGSPEPKP